MREASEVGIQSEYIQLPILYAALLGAFLMCLSICRFPDVSDQEMIFQCIYQTVPGHRRKNVRYSIPSM